MNCSPEWAAGFWEADGSVHLRNYSSGRRPTITATQSYDPAPLLRLQEWYGGHVKKVGDHHWRWELRKTEYVGHFAEEVLPFVSLAVKRKKLKVAIQMVPCIVGEGARSYGRQQRRTELELAFKKL